MTQEIDSDLSRLVTQNDVEINLEFLKKNKEKNKGKAYRSITIRYIHYYLGIHYNIHI